MNATLSAAESSALAACEAAIEHGLATFVEVGEALLKIRQGRLYRATHKTFEKYCRERWGWSKTHVNRQVQAAEVAQNLTPIGVIPKNEAQARELRTLSPKAQREVARRVDLETVTATELRQVVVSTKKEKSEEMARKASLGAAARANETRTARIADLKRVCHRLAELPQPVSQADFRKAGAPKGNGMISELSIFPWFRLEVVPGPRGVIYRCSINEELRAICDAFSPTGTGLETPAHFFERLLAELRARRAQLDGVHRNRKWDLDQLVKLDLVNLLDWVERELLTFGKSVAIAREEAGRKLQLMERKDSA